MQMQGVTRRERVDTRHRHTYRVVQKSGTLFKYANIHTCNAIQTAKWQIFILVNNNYIYC